MPQSLDFSSIKTLLESRVAVSLTFLGNYLFMRENDLFLNSRYN